MNKLRISILTALVASTCAATSFSSAYAGSGPIARRGGYAYVSPEMMHAIDVIVAEKMKMKHRHK